MRFLQNQEPFVLVLLDGDGMIFNDSFLTQGEQGGKDAANQLWASVHDYIGRNFSNVQSPKIVARVYANVKGLADVCYKTGIVEKSSMVEDFTRGFNGSRLLFDFVDVGSGKDRADDKLTGRTAQRRCRCYNATPLTSSKSFLGLICTIVTATRFSLAAPTTTATPGCWRTWSPTATS